ncbi:MAG: hypothetical protein OHK0045_22110 [Raineya sp.]
MVKAKSNQNFECKCCKKQFEYKYSRADPWVKKLMVSLLLRGNGIRDTAVLTGSGSGTVLRVLLSEGKKCEIKPQQAEYESVQAEKIENKDLLFRQLEDI